MQLQPFTGKAAIAIKHPSPSIYAYEGAVRSSKTTLTLVQWVHFIRTGPSGLLAMCGRTERTVINNLILPLIEMLGEDEVILNRGDGYVMICGRRVNLYGADNEASSSKIRGLTLAGAYVDEATEIPESFFDVLYTRLSVKGAKLWLTCNPAAPEHWVHEKWLTKARLWVTADGDVIAPDVPSDQVKDVHRYTFLLEDNPTLDAEYVERQKRSYSGVFYERNILARWVAAEGLVYPSWNRDTMVRPADELEAVRDLVAGGFDHGMTNATIGLHLGVVDHEEYGACLAVLAEWAPPELADTLDQAHNYDAWVDGLPEPLRYPDRLYVDPSAKSLRGSLRKVGYTSFAANNSVADGIQTVAQLMGVNRLLVSDACPVLIKELNSYVWDEKASQRGEDKPLKKNDHAADALRYAVHTSRAFWGPYIDL